MKTTAMTEQRGAKMTARFSGFLAADTSIGVGDGVAASSASGRRKGVGYAVKAGAEEEVGVGAEDASEESSVVYMKASNNA